MITWHRAAVDAPGGAGHVGRALRAQEHDRRGDLVRPRPGGRSAARARLRERLVRDRPGPDSAADWSARPPCADPQLRLRRAGADRVHEHAVGGAAVRPQSRQRQLRRLRDGVLGHVRATGRLPAVLETFTTRPQPRSRIPGTSARIARSEAITFRSQAACQSSSGTSSRSRQRAVPALLTSTSGPPERVSRRRASMRSPASGSVTSQASDGRAATGRAAGLDRRSERLLASAPRAAPTRPRAQSCAGGLEADAAARAGHHARPCRRGRGPRAAV